MLLISLVLIAQFLGCLSLRPETQVDITWDFNEGVKDGWGNATSEELGMQTRIEHGELRGSIVQWNPHIDSPLMFIATSNRHYVVMRMMYYGSATKGNLLLKYGPTLTHDKHVDFIKEKWTELPHLIVATESGGENSNYAADDSLQTAWTSHQTNGNWIVFDSTIYRWVTGIQISSSGLNDSPKRCLFQQSVTSGYGPFVTVSSFVLDQTQETQTILGFQAHSRYWRLFIIDNYGGNYTGLVEFQVISTEQSIATLPFDIDNTGTYKNYYLPVNEVLKGPLVRMRFNFFHEGKAIYNNLLTRPSFRESVAIDYIRIVRAPEIWKIRGCIDKYYNNPDQYDPQYNVTSLKRLVNERLEIKYYLIDQMDLQYASTYDCPHTGNVPISINGVNFGENPRVYVDGNPCPVLSTEHVYAGSREQIIRCTLPPSNGRHLSVVNVRVESGDLPSLFHNAPYFSYARAAAAPDRPMITNIGARKVDIIWKPPGDVFDNMMTTGYKIVWFQPQYRSRVSNITVGNITTTSIRGLEPNTPYIFCITALAEGITHGSATLPTDLYGRRELLEGYFESPVSIYTNITYTMEYDFDFKFFNSNQTLNSSSASPSNSVGPTGVYGSEGNYGLVIVGSAHIQNCNASTTCCDGYNATIGVASCGTTASVCAVFLERRLSSKYSIDGNSRRQVSSNIPYENGAPPEKVILTVEELRATKGADLPSMPCGPALRLTPSFARESGSVWYRRRMNVREGFDTTFVFEISNPSLRCSRLDDVNTYCRSRGADGLAFVIQNESPIALGNAGSGLGYEGIFNSLAVEIDTFFNYDQMDYYENHIAVMTQVYYLICLYLDVL